MNQNPDADREPRDTDAPLAIGGAASDLEGAVGTKNRAHFGDDPDDKPGPDAQSDTRSGQNPPAELSQRREEGGDQLSSQQSQAAFKSGTLHESGLAGQVEASTDDEMPTRDMAAGSMSDGPDPSREPGSLLSNAKVPDELARPAGEFVADVYKRVADEGDSAE